MTRTRRRHHSEHGFVMVPVIALLAVALGLGIALLAIVDTQTTQGSSQRMSDAAQTLSEGVAAAATNALSSNPSAVDWPITGSCQTFTGNLTTAPTGTATSLSYRVAKEVWDRFNGSSTDYASATRSTTWKVNICPVAGTGNGTTWNQNAESRWSDSYLTRTISSQPAGAGPAQVSLWVRGQAAVRTTGATKPALSRAVATKVLQSVYPFVPPTNFAVGTGSFSTDLGTGLNGLLTNVTLVSGLLSQTLGIQPIIKDTSSKIGVRCGLLTKLIPPNLNSLCLSGTLAGVAQTTAALGLSSLNSLLGIDRTVSLPNWTMAPPDAIAAYKAAAQSYGVYKATVPGTTAPASAPECYTDATTAQTVVYIAQVGTGDQYCTITGTAGRNTAKILIIEKGRVRITGPFTGVVYALNKAECTQSDGTCSSADHTSAVTREVVRIEGNAGKVTGSVWADGAGGAVGIYPSFNTSSVNVNSLLGVGNVTTGICGIPIVGTALSGVTSLLGGVLSLVGNILGGLIGTQEEVRYPGGSSAPTSCDLLKGSLDNLTPDELLQLYNGTDPTPTVPIVVSEHRTRNCTLFICGSWSAWSTRDSTTVTMPTLLTSALSSVVGQVSGLLGGTLGSFTAIQYSDAVVTNAAAQIPTGAGPVVGSYRNIGSN
jgi:hypothetical protein